MSKLVIEWCKEVEMDGETFLVTRESEMEIRDGYLDSQESFEKFLHEQLTDYNRSGKRIFSIRIKSDDWWRFNNMLSIESAKTLRAVNDNMIEKKDL